MEPLILLSDTDAHNLLSEAAILQKIDYISATECWNNNNHSGCSPSQGK